MIQYYRFLHLFLKFFEISVKKFKVFVRDPKTKNIKNLIRIDNIDGFLIGGASTNEKIFIEFEQKTEEINEGEMIVVPKGIKHKPYADSEAKIMIIEPKGVINTGDIKDKLTAPNDDWI